MEWNGSECNCLLDIFSDALIVGSLVGLLKGLIFWSAGGQVLAVQYHEGLLKYKDALAED